MYQKILLAVDGSPTSDLALLEAAKIANGGGTLRVITVAVTPALTFDAPYGVHYDVGLVSHAVLEQARDILAQAQKKLQECGIKAETKLLDLTSTDNRNIPGNILREADAWGADLIVLGTHGRSGAQRFFLGSVAEKVLRTSRVPVLLVRAPESLLVSTKNAEMYGEDMKDEIIGG